MSNLAVKFKTIEVRGKEVEVKLVQINNEDSMTVAQCAEIYGVARTTIRDHISEHKLVSSVIPTKLIKELRSQGVIPMIGRPGNWLPKQTVQDLAKVINTQEAWDVINQLWKEYETKKADINDFIQQQRDLLDKLEEQSKTLENEKRLKEDAIRRRGQVAAGREATCLSKTGVQAKKIKRLERRVEDHKLVADKKHNKLEEMYLDVIELNSDIKKYQAVLFTSRISSEHILMMEDQFKTKRLDLGLKKGICGVFKRMIKSRFLSEYSDGTWKEISLGEFDEAMRLIATVTERDIPQRDFERNMFIRTPEFKRYSCHRKVPYGSEKKVKEALIRVELVLSPRKFDYYRCKECGGFHLREICKK